MEKKLGIMFFVFVLLLFQVSELQGALCALHDEEGNKNNNWAWVAQEDKEPEMTQEFSHLIGEDKCEESDEECVKRRMISESHLDYIYTQSHGKP